jgi:hypothetical protein
VSQPLTKKSTDLSDKNGFSFSFFCDICGKKWVSRNFPFEKGGFTAIEHQEAENRIWADERRLAFEHANLEAHFHFTNCPKCGRWVCDDCFDIEGDDFGGLCEECSRKLKERAAGSREECLS